MFNDLLLEHGWLGEPESNFVSGELVVAVGDGVKFLLHDFSVEWVKIDSLVSVSINANSH